MSTGLWNEPDVPHKGWRCVETTDLRADDRDAPLEICQMCNVQEIRYVHHMTHHGFTGELCVGCVCAEHMERDYVRPRRREAALKSAASRRARWLTRKWKVSRVEGEYLDAYGYRVSIQQVERQDRFGWGGTIKHLATGKRTAARNIHSSADDAKLAAFDTIQIFKQKVARADD